ncbi:MAG: type I-C CRISPR-associated protein Cas7/Csd2 [Elusimicrobia bacterium]|nr:type I-C CRISPR-associated protein Cas7/Csd2 [Elusimicrobiota bacterium]
MTAIQNRYDFVYLFDCLDGNPNGDPDAANAPRLDPQTLQGIVSDVCIKRKVRNYVQQACCGNSERDIFIQHHSPLNPRLDEACEKVGVDSYKQSDGTHDKKKAKARPTKEIRAIQKYLCGRYFDIRAFGGVLSTGPNAGQIRGPLQLTFSRSINPVIASDLCITRIADVDKETEGEMGRKNLIPYGLYRCHGFINANLAQEPNGTGFSEEDMALLWESLKMMFDHDRSASRGTMASQMLTVFKHVGTDADEKQRSTQAKLGCAPAHKLFELIEVEKKAENPRKYADYAVKTPSAGPLKEFPGVEVLRLL